MDRPPSFTSVVARSYIQLSDTSYNNQHGPPSLGSVAMVRLQLSDPVTNTTSYNNGRATSLGSVAMAQVQISDPVTYYASYNNEQATSVGSVAMVRPQVSDEFTDNSCNNNQAPSMTNEKEESQSASHGFGDNAPPMLLTSGRDESYSSEATPKKELTFYQSLQNYRPGQQAKKRKNGDPNNENSGDSYEPYNMHSTDTSSNSLRTNHEPAGEFSIAEALIPQLELQKSLREQLEVQGKYLQGILENVQKSQSLDMKSSGNLEATRAELTNFNFALSDNMQNLNAEQREENITKFSLDSKKGAATVKEEMKIKTERGGGGTGIYYDFIGLNQGKLALGLAQQN